MPPMPPEPQGQSKPKGANRSTKAAGKLKVLPEQPEPPEPPVVDLKTRARREHLEEGHDESGTATATAGESDEGDIDEDSDEMESVEVYNQISLIPEGTARRDAMRLTKKKAKSLPRVTAYATASSFRMDDVMKFLNARRNAYHTNPKLIDEVIYSPYSYHGPANDDAQNSSNMSREADLLGVPELRPSSGDEMRTIKRKGRFDASNTEAEIYIFDYGTVVVWGMSEAQEKRLLSSLRRFEVEPLAQDDVEMEDLNYYYANYSRIYNDVITLRKGSGYMTKLSLSHALSQSVKISLFESLISNTIEETKDIPEIISETGKIGMPHKEIMQQIGQLFLLRSNINSVGSVLDSPVSTEIIEILPAFINVSSDSKEVFWSFPDQQPLYDAARSYLEIPQRINLLNTRVEVLQDMLQLLKESVSSKHGERLEQIVIALIGVEIGIVTILVDLLA
ncbi:sporulation protein rmd1 [Marasmius sp. AFHP31]|nr:sporulation protein rmd1 [Marasmius sp. AFHP31]